MLNIEFSAVQVIKHEGRTPLIFIEIEATTDNKEYRACPSVSIPINNRR
jgi:hypothetical protein